MNAGEFIAENKSFMVFEWIFFKLDYLENMLNTFSVTRGIMIKILGINLFTFLCTCLCIGTILRSFKTSNTTKSSR